MTTYNTGNPVPSADPRDRYDNSENLDVAVNSDQETFIDRLGKSRLTWAGIVKSGSGDPAIAVDAAARAESAASSVGQNAEQIAQDAARQAASAVIADVGGSVSVAQDAADRAEGAATRAEASAIAAYSSGNLFDNTTSGIAATVNGQFFLVRTADPQVFNVYLNDGGTATASGQFSVPINVADKFSPIMTIQSTGSSSAQAASVPNYTEYRAGDTFIWLSSRSNGRAITLDINGLGPLELKKNAEEPLAPNDILQGRAVVIRISGTSGDYSFFVVGSLPSDVSNDGSDGVSGSLALSNPNLFTEQQVAGLDKGGADASIVSDIHEGIPCWSVTGSIRRLGLFARGAISGDTLSAAVRILDWQDPGVSIRVLIAQYSSPSSQTGEVSRQEVSVTRQEFTPGFLRISNMPIHEDCQSIGFFIGGYNASAGTIKYRDMLLCSGGDATFRVPAPTSATGSVREVWVSPTGSNGGSGSSSLPFATLARAVSALDGRGTIYLAAGSYDNQQLSAYNVTELRIVGGADSEFKRSMFRYGTKLALASVAGRQGVYSSPLSRTPAWLWADGIPDEQTLVPYNEQHSLLDGRSHRLESTKIWHIPADNLADALDLIEGSATPVCWRDAATNTIYFSLPGGASGVDSDVRAAFDDIGLISSSRPTWSPEHHIELTGVDIRYGNITTKSFRTSILTGVRVLGAGLDGFDVGNWSELSLCSSGGCGSGDGLGDGFNAHNHAIWTYRDCYGHDNWDDGESSHQNCKATGWGNIMEYNGGSGFTPALGAQEILHNCLSRKNATAALRTGNKMGGFQVTGDPTPTDPGVITSLETYNCISIGDRNGFHDGTSSAAPVQRRLLAVNCKVFDAEETAFACAEIRDCSESGSGQAKSSGTTVANTTLIV